MGSRRILSALFLLAVSVLLAEDTFYQKPPKPVADALSAPPIPTVSVSPQRDYAIFLQSVRYPPIADVAQPMLRLAGIRIDSNTNGLHLAPSYVSYAVKRLSDGADVNIAMPRAANLGPPVWSPDGKQFAFTNTVAHGIELWMASIATGQAHRIDGVAINGVLTGGGGARPVEWLGDNRTLIVHLIPAVRGVVPAEAATPKGPHVQESLGTAGPAPTYEDLLSTPHDEDLFDYYATTQLAYLDSTTGQTTPFGKPAIYTTVRPSPDLKHVLVAHLHKPYSYQLPARSFPEEIEVWDRAAKTEYKVASLPLADHVPLEWRPHGTAFNRVAAGKARHADLGRGARRRQSERNSSEPRQDSFAGRALCLAAIGSFPRQRAISASGTAGRRQSAGGRHRPQDAYRAHHGDRSRQTGVGRARHF